MTIRTVTASTVETVEWIETLLPYLSRLAEDANDVRTSTSVDAAVLHLREVVDSVLDYCLPGPQS